MKSPGRPKRPPKYERFTSIGLSISDDFIMRHKAAKAGLPLSGYLRKNGYRWRSEGNPHR